jgi:hypothetical protein
MKALKFMIQQIFSPFLAVEDKQIFAQAHCLKPEIAINKQIILFVRPTMII